MALPADGAWRQGGARRRRLDPGEGAHGVCAKASGLCRELLRLWAALWRFLDTPGVEPTNNAAERALRPAVLWRRAACQTGKPAAAWKRRAWKPAGYW